MCTSGMKWASAVTYKSNSISKRSACYVHTLQIHFGKHCWCLVIALCLILCSPMDCSPPGSFVHGISQANYCGLWFPSPGDPPDPGIRPLSPAPAGRFFTLRHREALGRHYSCLSRPGDYQESEAAVDHEKLSRSTCLLTLDSTVGTTF